MKTIEHIALELADEMGIIWREGNEDEGGILEPEAIDFATKLIAAWQEQQEPVAWDSIEQMASSRYKVVPSDSSMFFRFSVVAGDGAQQLYLGREVECENMARKFTGAFLDGAFAAANLAEEN